MKPSEIIREYGWKQIPTHGYNTDDPSGFTMLGAIVKSARKRGTKPYRMINAVREVVPFSIVSWNAYPHRTKEEVIDKLEEAGL